MILSLLVEGNSIRSVERITDVHRDTIMRLLVSAGTKPHQNFYVVRNLLKALKVLRVPP